jgi:NADH:ubiquinone oxidoreductase subunit 4 (subunit M)
MLVCLICVYFLLGTTNVLYLFNVFWDLESEISFFFFFFIAFAIKIPMFPFYI